MARMEVLFYRLLCLWVLVCTMRTSYGQSECTSGFMSRDRVRDLSRVVGGNLRTRQRQQRIIPMINFTCYGSINKWTVAAEWDDGNDHTNFPELEIWRIRSAGSNVYDRVGSTLTVGAVENTREVYEFVPSSPLQFQPGDILGIFNPDKPRLAIYYVDRIGPPNYRTGAGTSPSTAPFTISANTDSQNDMPLITVDTSTSNGNSDCTNGFASLDGIVTALDVVNRGKQQRIIPHINFTCDGAITKWIVAGRWDNGGMHDWYPDLQIWRSNGTSTNMFTKVGNTTLCVESGSRSISYYEYNLTTPLNFQAGDVLGIFQPDMGKNRLRLYFQSNVGPQNYYETLDDNDVVEPPSDMFTLGTIFEEDLPLVAVEIYSANPAGSQATDTPGGSDTGSSSGAAIGAVLGVLAGVMTIIVVLVATFFLWRKKSFTNNNIAVGNPTYGGEAVLEPVNKDTVYEIPREAAVYEMPVSSGTFSTIPEWGINVPTESQRKAFPAENVYALPDVQSFSDHENSYFTESEIYWAPSSNVSELYAQLSEYKFREILRPQISVVEHLGSGQFGTVNKGVWQSPGGVVEVAVKMLKSGSDETDQVKFLQEAAIMGQFKHTNVIKLHGVVTVGVPTMVVLELMPHGDLRDFLIQRRPIPGELVPSSMPQSCLNFCNQIASGMEYLAGKAFVHRDLAARNILVAEDGSTCKISDFGMARDLEDSNYYISHGGKIPVKWTAPEALSFKKYSTASDVWSYGAVMYEIWSLGHKPFEEYANMNIIRLVSGGYRLAPPPGCPKAVYSLMIQCWHPQASSRPTFYQLQQALSHSEAELLVWTEEDTRVHPQAAVLGAPLEAGKDLYPQLQETYNN